MEDNQLRRAERAERTWNRRGGRCIKKKKKISAQTEATSQPTDSRVQECYRHDDIDTGQLSALSGCVRSRLWVEGQSVRGDAGPGTGAW